MEWIEDTDSESVDICERCDAWAMGSDLGDTFLCSDCWKAFAYDFMGWVPYEDAKGQP